MWILWEIRLIQVGKSFTIWNLFLSAAAAVSWKPVEPVEQLVLEQACPFTATGEQHLIDLPVV